MLKESFYSELKLSMVRKQRTGNSVVSQGWEILRALWGYTAGMSQHRSQRNQGTTSRAILGQELQTPANIAGWRPGLEFGALGMYNALL